MNFLDWVMVLVTFFCFKILFGIFDGCVLYDCHVGILVLNILIGYLGLETCIPKTHFVLTVVPHRHTHCGSSTVLSYFVSKCFLSQ